MNLNLNLKEMEDNIHKIVKIFFTLHIFQQALAEMFQYHFLMPKNCILEALWKQMSVYFCISLSENLCSIEVIRFYLVRVWGMGWAWCLNNFLRVDRCLGLVKLYTIFRLTEIFGNSTIFHTLLISIYHFPRVIH